VLSLGVLRLAGGRSADEQATDVATAPATTPAAAEAVHIVAAPPTANAALPTIPNVSEPALVAPSLVPDRDLILSGPVIATRFVPRPAAAREDDDFDTENGRATATPIPASAMVAVTGGPLSPDPRVGSQRLIEAAAAGDPAAAFEVAARYAEGELLPKDLSKAAEWYERAAEGGLAVAQYRLGSLYERGQGVAKDLTKAAGWYQRAADQGNVNAMHNLAVLMSEGVDDGPDAAKALQWFVAAADYGVRDSQYNLGVIYARGLGVAPDFVRSYKWFAVAAAGGDPDAAQRRDEVGEALAADDLATARAEAEGWRVKAPLADANGVAMPAGGWDDDQAIGIAEADRQALVRKIQTLLAEQGYDPGPADGLVGPKTRQAVMDMQRRLGAPVTGEIDTTLVALLADGNL
jgi:localization factor PodJL